MKSGIYLIYNLKIKGIYVGQSINVKCRLMHHRSNLSKDKNLNLKTNHVLENSHLFNAVKKYGIENYKFLFYKKCNENELTYNEQWLCDFFRSLNWTVYNFRECVDSNKGESSSGKNNPMFGVHRYGQDNPFYAHKHTTESIEKIRQSKLGYKDSDITRKKKSEARNGGKNPNAKLTQEEVCEIVEKYVPRKYSQYKLSVEYGVHVSTIQRIVSGNSGWNTGG